MSLYPKNMFFTSESVTEGHPDKLCDQISDAVLDECLKQDPHSRVACECYVTDKLLVVGGEITTKAELDIAKVVNEVGAQIGYSSPDAAFGTGDCALMPAIRKQSPDIAMGVERDQEIGAGDQGMMFGYACNQTPELMPLPILLAHRLAMQLANVRKAKILPWLRPDGKSQVTVEYKDGRPLRVDHVVIAAQHDEQVVTRDGKYMSPEAKQNIIDHLVVPVLNDLLDDKTKITINGTGKFLVGGPRADTGLTGRKNVVDTYGGWAMNGGGALSGKDATKVDRSGSYMSRYIAKNVVAAGLADECIVQLAYCIGLPEPVSVMVNTCHTGKLPDEKLTALVREVFPLSTRGMIEHLHLDSPIYSKTASYGHFGRADVQFAWEEVNATEKLLERAIIPSI